MSEQMRNPSDEELRERTLKGDPWEEDAEQEEGSFSLISVGEFYDLLMEQQEQM